MSEHNTYHINHEREDLDEYEYISGAKDYVLKNGQAARIITWVTGTKEKPLQLCDIKKNGDVWECSTPAGDIIKIYPSKDENSWTLELPKPEASGSKEVDDYYESIRFSKLYYKDKIDDVFFIGRLSNYPVLVKNYNDERISTIHFGFRLNRDGTLSIVDNNSTNGTFVCSKNAGEDFTDINKGVRVELVLDDSSPMLKRIGHEINNAIATLLASGRVEVEGGSLGDLVEEAHRGKPVIEE